ncbi:MAG: nucleotidyl transferase AbiEii/AbiGii toxin family protein [Nitrospirota bacterium]
MYSRLVFVYEKLRALCQQMEEYKQIIPTIHRRPRPRDFFDVYSVLRDSTISVDIYAKENLDILRYVFAAKRVPLQFLKNLENEREFHRQGFDAVRDTVNAGANLQPFDFYFDYVLGKVRDIIPLLAID